MILNVWIVGTFPHAWSLGRNPKLKTKALDDFKNSILIWKKVLTAMLYHLYWLPSHQKTIHPLTNCWRTNYTNNFLLLLLFSEFSMTPGLWNSLPKIYLHSLYLSHHLLQAQGSQLRLPTVCTRALWTGRLKATGSTSHPAPPKFLFLTCELHGSVQIT